MRFMSWPVLALALVAAPAWSGTTTIWGGVEDLINGDYDYNDLVFSISGSDLTLESSGTWQSALPTSQLADSTSPTLGAPFWNNESYDGSRDNIGWCIYGGGNCNGGNALDPGAEYLATSTGGSVNDVTFSVNGNVDESVVLHIAADTDVLGWELVGSSTVNYFDSDTQSDTFDPGGNFILVAENDATGDVFDSNSAASDGLSHFAFFSDPPPASVPEPSTGALFGVGLIGALLAMRRRLGIARR